MKLFTKTFGCQMNFADSDEMGQAFAKKGFRPTHDIDEADAVLINTCTVRDMAEHKAVSFVGSLKTWKLENPRRVIVVTGCAAEQRKNTLQSKFPFVDLVVGAKDIERFPTALNSALSKFENFDDVVPDSLQAPINQDVIQMVTIMRGCNYKCTYCIVPAVRGREIYIPAEKILNEVRARVAAGAREIWLLGQTVNSYRPENPPFPGYDFADLLRDVNAIPGLDRLRFISPHPHYLTPKLIDAMAECEKVCEHLHLPVQSGNNRILKLMKRNYTRESFLEGVRRLREKIPNICLTTDIIVGFPGETDAEFQETLSLVSEADFSSAYCFKYSPRPGTPAADLKDDISDEIKDARLGKLLELIDGKGAIEAQKLIGSVQDILLEEDKGNGIFRGRTRSSMRARLVDENLKVGQMVNAKITGTHSRELKATLL